jgi:hypothetical protein
MSSLKKRKGKHAQKRTATGTTPSVRPPVRKRKSSDCAEHTAFEGRSLIFCYGATDRVFTEGAPVLSTSSAAKKWGLIDAVRQNPNWGNCLSQFPKVEIESKRFKNSVARRFAASCSGGPAISVSTSTFLGLVDGIFTGSRYFFYGAFPHS